MIEQFEAEQEAIQNVDTNKTTAQEFLCVLTLSGHITHTNADFRDVIGADVTNFFDCIPAEDRNNLRLMFLHNADHPLHNWHNRIFTADGLEQWISWNITVNETQKTWHFTGHRIAPKEKSLHLISSILESITDAFFALDDTFRFIYVNAEAEKLLQQERNHLIGRSIWAAFPEAINSTFQTQYEKALKTQQKSEFLEYYAPLDIWLEVNTYPSTVGLSVYFRDVTHRKRLEQRLNEIINTLEDHAEQRTEELTLLMHKQARFVQVLELTSDLVSMCDSNGWLTYINQAGKDMIGIAHDASAQKYRTKDFYDDETWQHINDEIIPHVNRDGIWQGEITITTLNNKRIITSQVILRHQTDNEVIYSAVGRDITAQKQTEEELRNLLQKQKELAELRSRITSMVSHEFRTPLATIRSSSDLLHSYHDRMTPERQREYIEKIQAQITHLSMLMDSVVTINREESIGVTYTPKRLHIAGICREIVMDIQLLYRDSHTIGYSVVGEDIAHQWDERLIRQLVINLLSNAIKYSPKETHVSMTLAHEAEEVIITVTDQGIGIPEDDFDRIFESFHRGSNVGTIEGTGLGMPLIKQAVDAHGGTVDIQSAVDQGSTFTVTLPIR